MRPTWSEPLATPFGLAVVRVSGYLPGPQEKLAFLAIAASIVGLALTLAGVAAGSGSGSARR